MVYDDSITIARHVQGNHLYELVARDDGSLHVVEDPREVVDAEGYSSLDFALEVSTPADNAATIAWWLDFVGYRAQRRPRKPPF